METETEARPNGETRAAPATAPRRSRRPFAILGALALVVLASIGIYLAMTAGKETTDDAQVAADLVPIGARVAGQVVRVAVHENQLVKKGEPLAEIDDADYVAKMKQAEAELATAVATAAAADAQAEVVEATSKGGLASAKAIYSGSSVGVSSAEAQVAAARAAIVRAESDAHKADNDLRRSKELRSANAIPQERLDNAQASFDSAQAALSLAKAQLAAAEEQKRGAQARVSEAQGRLTQSAPISSQIAAARASAEIAHARVKSAEAMLELARLQLSYTKIAAPTDGMASKLTVREGALLAPGQSIVQLVPVATYVIANFKETQVGKMRPGQDVEIEIDAFPGRKLAGKVESISGGTGSSFSLIPADNASGNFVKVVQRVPVRIAWQNPPTEIVLRAGMSADVSVLTGK